MDATTRATITPELRERARAARSDWKGTEAEFKEAVAKLSDAIAQADMRLIQSARRVAESATRAVAQQIGFTDKIITDLRAVQDAAEDGAPALKEAAKLIAELGTISAAAAKMFQAAKKLFAAADAKTEDLAKSSEEKDRKWAKGDAYIRQHCAQRRDAVKEMAPTYAQAEKAAKAGDLKALAAAQKKAQAIGKFRITLAQLRSDVKKIVDGVDAGHVASELRKQIETDTKAWATLLRGAEADEMQIALDRDAIDAFQAAAAKQAKQGKQAQPA
jgi:hypothetical protein